MICAEGFESPTPNLRWGELLAFWFEPHRCGRQCRNCILLGGENGSAAVAERDPRIL
jgi:hypothetical protein